MGRGMVFAAYCEFLAVGPDLESKSCAYRKISNIAGMRMTGFA